MSAVATLNWSCKHTWRRSAKNTAWCLLGCAIGDFGTILYFQLTGIPWPVIAIMTLAIINGLITSIILETIILIKQNFNFKDALKNVKKGDLVYLDPPYYDSVNYYNEIDFTHKNQKELRDEMIRLVKLGAHVIMSNSKSTECKKLFTSPHFDIREIPVTRTIQRKTKANHQYKEDTKELFITSCL